MPRSIAARGPRRLPRSHRCSVRAGSSSHRASPSSSARTAVASRRCSKASPRPTGCRPRAAATRVGTAPDRASRRSADWLRIERSPSAPRWGFFLRAETMHGYYSYLEALPDSPDRHLHSLSHGESFNDLLDNKLNHPQFRRRTRLPRRARGGALVLIDPHLDRRRLDRMVVPRHPGHLRNPLADPRIGAGRDDPRARGVGHPRIELGRPRTRRTLARRISTIRGDTCVTCSTDGLTSRSTRRFATGELGSVSIPRPYPPTARSRARLGTDSSRGRH